MFAHSRRTTACVAVSTAAVFLPILTTVVPAQADANDGRGPRVIVTSTPAAPLVTVTRAQLRHIQATADRRALVRYARTKLRGVGQYVAGASSANRFDCSGFTKQVYKHVLHWRVPHYSVSQMTMKRGHRIWKKKDLLPGDLLFWGPGGTQHVSMYIGRGKMIGANNPGSDVKINYINDSYWGPRYAGARRLVLG
jgi:cell wall-associated NlpC family hydrolase